MKKHIINVCLLIILVMLSGSGCRSDVGYLAPGEVNDNMLDTVVRVKGKIISAVVDPGGLGGIYMTLEGSGDTVDVRIQRETWDGYEDDEKELYLKGKTIVVEGILARAGIELVVVHGKFNVSANTTSYSP
jgi:hypothetical protein